MAVWIPGSSPYIPSVPLGETLSLPKKESIEQNRCANLDMSCAPGVGVAQNKPLTSAQRRAVAIYFSKVGTNFERAAGVAIALGNPEVALPFEIAAGVSGLLEQSFFPDLGRVAVDSAFDQAAQTFSKKSGVLLPIVIEAIERYAKPAAQPLRDIVNRRTGR